MIESSAGVVPLEGKATLTDPENPTGFTASMFNSGSLLINDQAEESITKVQTPLGPSLFAIVNGIDVGAGVMLEISNVRPLRVSLTFVSSRLTIEAVIVAVLMFKGKFVVEFLKVRFQ